MGGKKKWGPKLFKFMVMMTFSPFTCQAHHVDELIISGKRQKKKKKSVCLLLPILLTEHSLWEILLHILLQLRRFNPNFTPPWRVSQCSAVSFWAAPSVSASTSSRNVVGRNYWLKTVTLEVLIENIPRENCSLNFLN